MRAMRVLLLLAAATASMTMPAAVGAEQTSLAEPLAAPSNQVEPTITGTATLGGTLTASPGEWTGTAPITFSYQWMRCRPDCGQIPGATAQTYKLTKADAYRSTDGRKTVMTVYVIATNSYGSVPRLVEPATQVDAPLPRPRTVALAREEAMVIPDSASTIPQILAHNGYTAWYFPLHSARVTVTWTRGRTLWEDEPALAVGHRTFRHAGKSGTFKVRLTKRGRRLLAHAHHLTLLTTVHTSPLRTPAGNATGSGLALSTDAPSKLVSVGPAWASTVH
jgi:hypothetical protein